MSLIQYAGRDARGIIQHGIESSAVIRFRDFTGWTALTFRDLDTHRVIPCGTELRLVDAS